MAGAVRQVSIRRGIDPRDYVLVAFGGAGPPHAARLAQLVGIRRVLIPPHPGLGSCNGMLIADAMIDEVQTLVASGASLEAATLRSVMDSLSARLRQRGADLPAGERRLSFRVDLRYVGMGSELKVALEQHFGSAIVLKVGSGDVQGKSLAAIEQGEKDARQAQATQAVHGDRFVQDLVEIFDATVIDDTIRPQS